MNSSKQARTGRKTIIVVWLVGLTLWSISFAVAQQQAKVPRVGLLANGSASNFATRIDAFRQGLRDLGYVEGKNIVIEYLYSEGKMDRLPDLAAELVRLKVNLIVTHAVLATQTVKKMTTTIPIVVANVGNALATGLVTSLARPDGNITGLTNFSPELTSKGLELLRETFPSVTRVAFLANLANPMHEAVMKEIEAASGVLRVELQLVEVRDPDDFDSGFSVMTKKRAGALVVRADPQFLEHRTRIVKLASDNRLRTIFSQPEYAEAGGLMAYGVNISDLWRRAAAYVDRILKGAKPADLPVEQPKKFEFIINLKTAKQIGVTIPQSVLYRTDRVIK